MSQSGAFFVIASGPTGSGKSMLASSGSARLPLPLISKDLIKDALVISMPTESLKDSNVLGAASMHVVYTIARPCPSGAVLEANFYRTIAVDQINLLLGT